MVSQSPSDHCLFTMGTDSTFLALLVYVDDVLITGAILSHIEALKAHLHAFFTIKDLSFAKNFLGVEIARNYIGTTLA